MKTTKRLAGLLLASALLVSLFGCGGPTASSGKAASTASTASEKSSAAASKAAEAGSTPQSTDVPTYKVVTVRWTDAWPTDFLKTGIMKENEEAAGVNIDWQVYYDSDWNEQKSLLLASGDLPDAFWGSICLKDTDISQNQSFFTELTDLISPNMSNLTGIFEKDPSMRATVTDREGKIFSLPKKLPLRPQVNDVMYINKTWMDKLGLAMPTTTEELTAVLQAFVEKDPNGNGKNDEIGYSAVQALGGDLRHIMAPYGTMVARDNGKDGTNYMALTDGKPTFMPTQDNYKEAVKYVQDLYAKGLIDPECFTQDSSMVTAKTQDPGGALSGIVFGWTADAQVGINAKDYVVVPALAGPDGKRYAEHNPEFLDVSRNELLVTTKCTDPAKLLSWADLFYTDEASLQTFYGSVSDGKIAEKDGKYDVLVPEDGSSLDTSAWSFSMRDFGPKYMNEDFYDKVTLPTDQGDGVKLAEDSVNEKYIVTTFPVCSYTTEQNTRLATLTTDLYSYVKSQYAHWVVDGGIDAEWDAYLQQLEAMGLPELISIQEDAYAAYQETLKK